MSSLPLQTTLFGDAPPDFDPRFARLRHLALGRGAWIDFCPEWVTGQARLFDTLNETLAWQSSRREMYDRVVDVPRQFASAERGERPALIEAMSAALSARYGEPLDRVGFALYRDGRDSVAMHQDKVIKEHPRSLVALVSLGGPRRFLVRPLDGGGRSRTFSFGHGDLLVMGGTFQRFFEHGVPKAKRAAPRIAVMFRAQSV